MADEKWIIGDRVQLKSGGPVMTIESGDVQYGFTCVWCDSTGKLQREKLPFGVLKSPTTRK